MPSISKNLFLVGALTDEGKIGVFTKMHFLIWDNLKGRNILATRTRQRSNGLYKLILEPETNLITSEDRSKIWYQYHGHLHYKRLIHLPLMIGLKICQSYPIFARFVKYVKLGNKHVQDSQRHRAIEPSRYFELIHSDLVGLLPKASLNGYCYFVVFIDDYTKKSWV